MIDELAHEWTKLDNKARFILAVVKGEIIINKRKRADLIQELKKKNFTPIYKKKTLTESKPEDEDEESEQDEKKSKKKAGEKDSGYDYLLSMPLWSLTEERVRSQ